MRILYLTFDDLTRQFAGTVHVRRIVEGLRERNDRVMVVAPRLDPAAPPAWVDEAASLMTGRCRIAAIMSYLLFSIARGLRAAMRFRPHAIYCRGTHLNVTPAAIALLTGRPLATEINGMIEDEIRGPVRKWFARLFQYIQLKSSSRVVTVSHLLRRCLIRRYRLAPERVSVIPNGADLRLFRPGDRAMLRERLGIPRDAEIFVYAGGFYREHRLEIAVGALRRLSGGGGRDVRALFIGDGAQRPRIMAMARDLGVAERSTFTGELPQEKVAECLAASDAGLLLLHAAPTVKASSPVKMYEYMASGIPVVALIHSREVGDLIKEGGFGVVDASVGDNETDIANMERLMSRIVEDPDGAAAMGARGRRLAEERYNWDRASGEVAALLRSMTGNSGD